MRLYEIVYIFDATLDEDAVNKKLEQYQPLVVGSDGEVTAVDHWGVRQMAYPVEKKKTGYYVVAHVSAASDGLPERILPPATTILVPFFAFSGEVSSSNLETEAILGNASPRKPSDITPTRSL